MELFKLFGTIALNNSEANQGIDDTTGKAAGAGQKISEAFKKVGTAVATYFAVDKIIDFGVACVEAAADASAMNSQFTQVFGELEGQAAGSLTSIADQAGIAENRMKGSYTQIAAFAKTTGMETADALSLADRAMVAVADSAAFYDRSLEDTTESLQSFLKGNYENDAALGLSCTEVTRNAAANALYGQSFNELSESQKQLTLLQMVEDANAASGALGQAARESDTWTNQTGNLKQAWTDFKATVGENFLDPAVGAIKKVTDVVVKLTEKIPVVIEWFKSVYDRASEYFPAIQETFEQLWDEAQDVWERIGQPIFEFIQTIVEKVRDDFSKRMPEIREFVSKCFSDIQSFWNNNLKPCFDAIGNFIKNVLAPAFEFVFDHVISPAVDSAFKFIKDLWNNTLKPVFTGITDFLTGVFTLNFSQAFKGIVSVVEGIWNGIISVVKRPINTVIGIINSFIRGLNNIQVPDWVPAIGGKGINIPTIPLLEKGGVLERGQVGFLEGNGAEAVVPLDQNKKWIAAVAADMNAAIGSDNKEIRELKEIFREFVDALPEMMSEAFKSMKFDVNNREFARLVKAVN
jgi:hypothetical protein